MYEARRAEATAAGIFQGTAKKKMKICRSRCEPGRVTNNRRLAIRE